MAELPLVLKIFGMPTKMFALPLGGAVKGRRDQGSASRHRCVW